MRIGELLDKTWLSENKVRSVWVAGFRAHQFIGIKEMSALATEFDGVRLVFVHGPLEYFRISPVKSRVRNSVLEFIPPILESRIEENDFFTLICCPHDTDSDHGVEANTKSKIQVALGLLLASLGRNVAFERIFDNVLLSDGNLSSISSEVVENPLWFPSVNFAESSMRGFSEVTAGIVRTRKEDREKIHLSLLWFERATHEANGLVSFLMYWISIETLAMPNETNIRPLNELLARVHGYDYEFAANKFLVGRISRLRGLIVHNGLTIPIHGILLRYMEALFVDVFYATLGSQVPKRTKNILEDEDFDLSAYISGLIKKN